MNQKIPTWLGTVIIIIISATAAFFVWTVQKNNKDYSNAENFQRQQLAALRRKLAADKGVVGLTTFDRSKLEKIVSDTVSVVTGGNWDKKVEISAVDPSQNAAKGFWWAKDRWNWIAWKSDNDWWNVLINRDGFDCKSLDDVPSQHSEFFKDTIFQDGKKNCYDWNVAASGMKLYRNEKLGFEMYVPEKVSDGSVRTIENGNIVWILVNEGGNYRDNVRQMQSGVSEFEKVQGVPWAILVKTVNNDQELDKFIKDRYGKDCKLGEKELDAVSGMYDVQIDTGNSEPGEGCFLNWILHIKYSPELRKVAAWDQGQDVRFMSSDKVNSDGTSVYYDEEMTKSFKFIK